MHFWGRAERDQTRVQRVWSLRDPTKFPPPGSGAATAPRPWSFGPPSGPSCRVLHTGVKHQAAQPCARAPDYKEHPLGTPVCWLLRHRMLAALVLAHKCASTGGSLVRPLGTPATSVQARGVYRVLTPCKQPCVARFWSISACVWGCSRG